MKISKILFLTLSLLLTSCGKKIMETDAQKSKRHSEAGSRINESQQNSEDLFKDMD